MWCVVGVVCWMCGLKVVCDFERRALGEGGREGRERNEGEGREMEHRMLRGRGREAEGKKEREGVEGERERERERDRARAGALDGGGRKKREERSCNLPLLLLVYKLKPLLHWLIITTALPISPSLLLFVEALPYQLHVHVHVHYMSHAGYM